MIPGTAKLQYRSDIDGLRAVAVVAVLLHHVWPTVITGGFVGVDVFFVISGYLITRIVAGQIQAGTFTFASFYQRRARRLLPALLVMLVAVMAAGWFLLLPSDYLATSRAALSTTLLSSNVVFWRALQAGYFAPDAKLNPLLHTWSLGVEEQFYLVFPLLLMLAIKFAPARLRQIVVAGIVFSLGVSVALIGEHSVAVFFLAPFRAWELLVGAALAIGLVPSISGITGRSVSVALGLGAITAAVIFYTPATGFPGLAALLPVLGSAAVIHAGGPAGLLPTRVLSSRPVVYIGRISYSLYLWHWPLVVLVKYFLPIEVGFWLGCTLVAASLAMAALSYRFIELPFRSRRESREPMFLMRGIACSAAVACISLAGVLSGGFAGRVSDQARVYDQERHRTIPFKYCDARSAWCVIGDPRVEPTILFWGDSHMLAWAPAVDRELRAVGRSAYFAVYSDCPPVWGVVASRHPGCEPASQRVESLLSAVRGIQRVVIAANWNMYLQPHRIRLAQDDNSHLDEKALLARVVEDTIQGLRDRGMAVAILGPVPTYDHDVPLELAKAHDGMGWAYTFEPSQNLFGPKLKSLTLTHGGIYLDVWKVMCPATGCEIERDGRANYRDDNHLGVSGALAYSYLVREAIELGQPATGTGTISHAKRARMQVVGAQLGDE